MSKKHLIKIAAVALVLAMIVCCFSACATKLNGTYTSEGLIKQSFTFKEDNVVVMSAFGIEAEGTYVIEDDTITITYSLLNISYDWEKSFEKDGDSIFIDGIEFIKQK